MIELGASPGGMSLRRSLGDALGDPGLTVAYRLPGGEFVDDAGRPAALDDERGERVVTTLRHGGDPVGALVHDPAVLDDPELVTGVAATARVAVESARLRAEVRAQIAELAASRGGWSTRPVPSAGGSLPSSSAARWPSSTGWARRWPASPAPKRRARTSGAHA